MKSDRNMIVNMYNLKKSANVDTKFSYEVSLNNLRVYKC